MILEVDDVPIHAATGGVDLTGDDPVIVLIHGAGADSTVWQLQTRYLAYRGFRPLAIDLPGHGRSGGDPLESVAEMGRWLGRFLDTLGWGPATLVGHSMGTFIALEVAQHRPELTNSLVLLGTAATMPVHPDLLHKAVDDVPAAAALMSAWGHAPAQHIGLNPTPGMSMIGGQRALVEMSQPGALIADLTACASYDGGFEAAEAISIPVTIVVGHGDKMTPAKASRALASAIEGAEVIELPGVGHNIMNESPRVTREAIIAAATPPLSP